MSDIKSFTGTKTKEKAENNNETAPITVIIGTNGTMKKFKRMPTKFTQFIKKSKTGAVPKLAQRVANTVVLIPSQK
ncbi:hypothetical protein J5893_05405 [bacterium]|nr:hypothetical protein [bacterium]